MRLSERYSLKNNLHTIKEVPQEIMTALISVSEETLAAVM
jgi:hypothetical protein